MVIHSNTEIQRSIERMERKKRNEKIKRVILIVASYLVTLVIGLAI
jgi:hypothetical protein